MRYSRRKREFPYYKNRTDSRCLEIADFIIMNRCTIRYAASHFSVSKSTVHKDISERLRHINKNKYDEVKQIIEKNKAERHIRGGLATKLMYMNLHKNKKNETENQEI